MTTFLDRQKAVELIDNACFAGARLSAACDILDVSPRTVQRWRGQEKPDGRKAAAQQRTPGNKLSQREQDKILTICNQPEFANMPPNQIVPALADQGTYIASESSFYRVLRKADQLAHRGKAKPPTHTRLGTNTSGLLKLQKIKTAVNEGRMRCVMNHSRLY